MCSPQNLIRRLFLASILFYSFCPPSSAAAYRPARPLRFVSLFFNPETILVRVRLVLTTQPTDGQTDHPRPVVHPAEKAALTVRSFVPGRLKTAAGVLGPSGRKKDPLEGPPTGEALTPSHQPLHAPLPSYSLGSERGEAAVSRPASAGSPFYLKADHTGHSSRPRFPTRPEGWLADSSRHEVPALPWPAARSVSMPTDQDVHTWIGQHPIDRRCSTKGLSHLKNQHSER